MVMTTSHLSMTERLALLHTSVVLACSYAEFGWTRPVLFSAIACIGFLSLLFFVQKREQTALLIAKAIAPPVPVGHGDDFSLAITDVRRNPSTDRVEYRLDGVYHHERWTAWLRYSTLRQLRGRVGSKADDKFPEKTSLGQWVRGSDSDIAFVDERRRMLNRFLREAVPNRDSFEILAQVPQVRHALGIPDALEISQQGGKAKQADVVKEALLALDMTCDIAQYATEGGDGWKLHSRYPDGIACFLKREGDFTYAMGKGPMDVDKLKAMEFLLNLEHRKKWDELFKSQQELESFQKYVPGFSYPAAADPLNTERSEDWEILGLNISRSAFGSPAKAFVAERDTVSVGVMARRRRDGALCLALRSIEDPRAPEGLEGYVRARIIVAGFLFEDRTDGKAGCVMTTMGLVDPNGSIPQFVINLVAPARALAIRDINRACLQVEG